MCNGTWDKLAPDFFTEKDPRPYFGEVRFVCALGVRSYYPADEAYTAYLVVCDTHSAEFKDAVKHQSYFN
tara:strand:+ start:477 stop:686 length:210 start_codon:yes stop_codon:yes gene_type:complete